MASPGARAQRPCDHCRRRKIRCLFASDDAVACMLCQSRSTTCTYLHSPPQKKRALSSQQDASDKRRRIQPAPGVALETAQLPETSLLKQTLGHHNRQSSLALGASADFDPFQTHSLAWNAKGEVPDFRPAQILRRIGPDSHFIIKPDTPEEVAAELAKLDAIEEFVSPHGPELVKIYFRIVHPSFPILHKNVFLEKHGRSYRELTPVGLGAVYVLALNWWSYSPALSSLPKPNAKLLETKVLAMLFDAHQRPKISDLQGGLVLLQSPTIKSWAMTGHLVSMGQNLGINLDCTYWQVPEWERGVRKRVAWALYMQDKWSALVYGRGSHIRPDDWDVQPLDTSDFPETAKDDDSEEGSADIEKGKKTFLHVVALTEILSDILDQFYTLKALRSQPNIHDVLERAKPIQLRLRTWHANMPTGLSVDDTMPRKLSSVGYLHLAYYTAEITLHRAILRCHTQRSQVDGYSADVDLYAVTRQAAETRFLSALEFIKRLKAEHFQSFWYFSSSISLAIIGVFAGVLCATSATDDETSIVRREGYLAKLAEYRWILRISVNGAEFMNYAVGVLDAESQLLTEQFARGAAAKRGSTATWPIYDNETTPGEEKSETGNMPAIGQDTFGTPLDLEHYIPWTDELQDWMQETTQRMRSDL